MEDWLRDFKKALMIMEGHGLTEGFGHLSMRKTNGEIALTPAMGPGMSANDGLHISFDLNGNRTDRTELPAPLELYLHLSIYRNREDVRSICRTHSRYMVSLGVIGRPLSTSHGFGRMLGESVPCHLDGDLIHDWESGNRAARLLGSNTGMMLKGNGGLAVGSSIAQALVRAIYLEEAARIAIDVSGVGTPEKWTRTEIADRERWHDTECRRAWEYYTWRYAR